MGEWVVLAMSIITPLLGLLVAAIQTVLMLHSRRALVEQMREQQHSEGEPQPFDRSRYEERRKDFVGAGWQEISPGILVRPVER